MGRFLSYSIVSGLLMLAMYLAYRLFLAKEKQYGFNRGILLAIYFVSFLTIPIISGLDDIIILTHSLTPVSEEFDDVAMKIAVPSNPMWGTVLIWIFLAGMIIVTVKTTVTWLRLNNVIRHGQKIQQDGYTLVVTECEQFAPFSWINYVVIGRKDYDDNRSSIIAHELKHIASRHWVDLLIAQAVCIINWFNPAAWLMRDELMLIHEYQADTAVIESGFDPQEYQMLLIKKAVGSRFPSLANSLNHSKLKKRITMMYKEKSGAGRKFKALALVPMLSLALGVAAVPTVRAAVSAISSSEISVSKGSENLPQDKIGTQSFKVKNFNNSGNKTTIVVRGENFGKTLTVSGGTFTTKGKTYYANSMRCDMTNGTAVITVTFPFTSEYDKSSMTLNINGQDIMLDMEDFFNNAYPLEIKK